MLNIHIKTIQHSYQRYETPGDFFSDGVSDNFFVSGLNDWRYEVLIAVHELCEWALVKYACIDEKDITKFDQMFEEERSQGLHDKYAEAGDDPRAPYRKQHFIATTIERMLGFALNVDWNKYDEAVISLLPKEKVNGISHS